jgi:hypothetical protein
MRLAVLLLASAALTAQQYFPPGTLADDQRYSEHLRAFQEPSLWELSRTDPHAEEYRFLWLRSFHHPVAIRFVLSENGSSRIIARITCAKGKDAPGRICRYSTFRPIKARTQEWLAAFENAHFWDEPTLLTPPAAAVQVDGAQWIFEGVRNGKYHVVDRFSPDTSDPMRALGILALKFAQFKIPPTEIY